ncbi:MAG TPA: GNAT family N-acetyltransferase [Actinomycetota bacterium]|nr:GNAT family N-acetyltransferase [Actinomycetota bacterium]
MAVRWLTTGAGVARTRRLEGPIRGEARRAVTTRVSVNVFLSVLAIFVWAIVLQVQPTNLFTGFLGMLLMVSLFAAAAAGFMQPACRSPESLNLFALHRRPRGAVPGASIEQAGEDDVPVVLSILDEAAEWMNSRGVDIWGPGTFGDSVRDSVTRGETYVARVDGDPAATMRLCWTDPNVWDDADAENAGYVLRLAVRRAYAGTNLVPRMLEWAEARIRDKGRRWLRLDCSARVDGLKRYYSESGFDFVGEKAVGGGWVAALYQRDAQGSVPGPGHGAPSLASGGSD